MTAEERRVLEFVQRELVRDDDLQLSPEEALFSSGLLDSFCVTRLIVFLEDTFGVRVPIPEVRLEDFDSVTRCLSVVARLRAGGGA
jgi:acyl carrier protein